MSVISLIAIYSALCLIAIQDLKDRSVTIALFILLAISCISYNIFSSLTIGDYSKNVLINFAFLLVQGIALYFYFIVREKRKIDIWEKIGGGDVLFLCSIATLFSPLLFIFFYLGSLIAALLLHLIFRCVKKYRNNNHIPLAGFQSLFLILFIYIIRTAGHEIAGDEWILSNLNIK